MVQKGVASVIFFLPSFFLSKNKLPLISKKKELNTVVDQADGLIFSALHPRDLVGLASF